MTLVILTNEMNLKLAKIFQEMAVLLDIQDVAFKPRAYEHASYSLENLNKSVEEIYREGGRKALLDIPGVGQSIAEKMEEYIKTGRIKEYEKMKKKLPVDTAELGRIEGVGPKTIKKLYDQLKITNAQELKEAAEAGKLAKVSGLGKKLQERVLKSLGFLRESHGRFLLSEALPLAREMTEALRALPEVSKAEFTGSVRRRQETIGDLDILVISQKPEKVMDTFTKMPPVAEVLVKGSTKTTVRLKNGLQADVRVIPPESFGAALQYFVGDKYHNVAVREIAIKKGYKLNEYGLFKGKKLIAGKEEKEIYEKLGMEWIPPELRTNRGEIEAAMEGKLPKLVDYDDVKGDLQVQTDWTDGADSIEDMVKAAQKEGLEYICITDHTKSLAMTNGNDEKRLLKQMAEIDKIQKKFPGFKILKGAEVNILKDGSLDIDNETLAKLEVVGASVHSHFNMSQAEMTKRVIKAMENPHVDIIFHPTGRVIQKREGYKVDMDDLIKAAKRTKTVLEANAYPERLDLKDEYIRQAVEAGVKIAIDTDAHSVYHFRYLEYGIAQARRGWAEKKDVINAHSWPEMLKMLK